ncbi:MAG: 4Fe-4S binding protein [Gammaproteobacteria bacterium]|nr:4Fe-4S binding protein [Gammaproteobacteria bacterium]
MSKLALILLLASTLSLTVSAQPLTADSTVTEQDILQLFPKATVIGDKQSSPPVWPVYQLQELIGYVFETRDLTDITGFSGDPIDLLIGIDAKGQFTGVELMKHHEPIFMHGLGEVPLLEFIAQYRGKRVSDRVILKKPGDPSRSSGTGTVYFDAVSKATVSIIVVNDTVMSAALKVARQVLEDFAQQAPSRVRIDFFQPKTWHQLLEQGLVLRWQLGRDEVEQALGNKLHDYPGREWSETPDAEDIELYFAYLNAPSIGKNLLGEKEYLRLHEKLKTGEAAVLVMSRGFYEYISPAFKPGTIPERFNLLQNGLPMPLRDLNFYNYDSIKLIDAAPVFDNARIFRIRPQTGFDPSAAMDLQLNFNLKKNHLITDHASLNGKYELPANLFEKQPLVEQTRPAPVWVTIWQGRIPEVIVLLLALLILSIIFIKQQSLITNVKRFLWIRWTFLAFTLFFIGFYAQGQLSVVNIFTLLGEIIGGFDITVFLLDPIIFILWSYTAITLLLWGRGVFCGWLCPFGALQEVLSWIAVKMQIRQLKLSELMHKRLQLIKYLILTGLTGISLFSLNSAMLLAEIEPFKTAITLLFIRSYPFVAYTVILLGIGLYISKFYCRYLCPLGAGLAIIGKTHLFEKLWRRDECGSKCQLCRNRCQLDAIDNTGIIDYNECIQCLECLAIINDKNQCAIDLLASKQTRAQNSINAGLPVYFFALIAVPLAFGSTFGLTIAAERDNAAEAVSGLKAYAAFKAGDYVKARLIWQQLAAQGNTTALINLANLFQQGKGVSEDRKHALEYIIRAAQLGDSRAQYELGIEYEKGVIVPRDINKAATWLQKSALQGDSDGQFAYAVMLATAYGKGLEYSSQLQRREAIDLLKKAAANGHPDASQYARVLSE